MNIDCARVPHAVGRKWKLSTMPPLPARSARARGSVRTTRRAKARNNIGELIALRRAGVYARSASRSATNVNPPLRMGPLLRGVAHGGASARSDGTDVLAPDRGASRTLKVVGHDGPVDDLLVAAIPRFAEGLWQSELAEPARHTIPAGPHQRDVCFCYLRRGSMSLE